MEEGDLSSAPLNRAEMSSKPTSHANALQGHNAWGPQGTKALGVVHTPEAERCITGGLFLAHQASTSSARKDLRLKKV